MAAAPLFNEDAHLFRRSGIEAIVESAVEFFLGTPAHPPPPIVGFEGAGVYALYYNGSFDPYAKLAAINRTDCSWPIYVGKAVASGWRTGRSPAASGRQAYQRLREHARNIGETRNLADEDFRCRFVLLRGPESSLIPTLEARLIHRYSPLWNSWVSGFGLHHVGGKRFDQIRTQWDTLHPGRLWTGLLTSPERPVDPILESIRTALSSLPPP